MEMVSHNNPQIIRDILTGDQHKYKTIVLVFGASWCRPCQKLKPALNGIVCKYPHALFYNIDVDLSSHIAEVFRVSSYPTTLISYKNGGEKFKVLGFDLEGIISVLEDEVGVIDMDLTADQDKLSHVDMRGDEDCSYKHMSIV